MEKLKSIKECLVAQIQGQLGDLKKVDAKEMGEVIDMIKDLEEAMYYCSITKAMEKSSEEKNPMNVNYYMEGGYDGQSRNANSSLISYGRGNSTPSRSMNEHYYVPYMEYAPYLMRDENWRDKSGISRRMYMEGKQHHKDDQQSMRELENYIQDLGEDLTDMIKSSSNEEKQILSAKLQQLAAKVNK